MTRRARVAGSALTALLVATDTPAMQDQGAGLAARVHLADGTSVRGFIRGLDEESLAFQQEGRTVAYAINSIHALSFVPQSDFWREREATAGHRRVVVLRDGIAIPVDWMRLTPTELLLREPGQSPVRRIPTRTLRRIYLHTQAIDFAPPMEIPYPPALPDDALHRLATTSTASAEIRLRIEATAHREDRFERHARASLLALEASVRGLRHLLSRPMTDPTVLFTAIESFAARADDADLILGSGHSYESLQHSWRSLRDGEIYPLLAGLRTASLDSN